MQSSTLHNEDVLHEGYWPKMLLYALNELFSIFDQVKRQRGTDERLIIAYEILCLSMLRCTEQWHGSEKKGMPDTLSLLNVNDARHLKCLTWVVYDGALLVGRQPEILGNHQWCTMLVGLYGHIYQGCNDVAHCPPYTLASWNCQERTEALCQEGKLGFMWSGHWRASRSRRSRSSSRHHSRMLAPRDWNGHSCCSPPNMPPRWHCGEPLSPGAKTTPKFPLAVNVPAYAQSSCSGGGMARASLDDEEVWEDDFQTQHSPAHHVVRQNGGSHGEPATERMEASRGSPGWWSFFQVDIGEEELETLDDINPHWRATRWLQVAVQDIAKEEVPWYELVTPLTLGAEGVALSLAKHLLVVWWWNIKVCGEDDCPPALTILNIGQFMTDKEMVGGVGEPHWFVTYSHTLQQVGKAAGGRKWEWPQREALEVRAS